MIAPILNGADKMPMPYLQLPPQRFVASVQGLRGISAISVLCVHVYLMAFHGGFFPTVPTYVQAGLSALGNGVALFFIISGFVIPASLFRHKSLRKFLVDRCLRIMPVFVAIHLIVFSIGPLLGYKWLSHISPAQYAKLFLTNLTFLALPLGLPLAQQNSWTLTYEWGFYLFLGAAWAAATISRSRLVLGLVALLASMVCFFFPLCSFFVTGIGLAFYRIKLRLNLAAEVLLVPVAVVLFYFCSQNQQFYFAVPAGIIIFWAALQEGSVTSRFLSTKPLQRLGLISYSLYLIHPLAMFPFQMLGSRLAARGVHASILFPLFVIASIPTVLALSALSYDLLEVRLRSEMTRWFKPDGLANDVKPAATAS